MELDKIKEVWKNTDLHSGINEDNIHNILDKRGQTSLELLIRYEKVSLCVLPFVVFLPWVHNYILPTAQYPVYTMVLFIGLCIAAFFSQIYKIGVLKKIDLYSSNILSSSKQVAKYRKFTYYELLICLCWFMVFFISYVFSLIYLIPGNNIFVFTVLQLVIMCVAIVIIVLSYRQFYNKHIKKIEKLIEEIKEFENE